MIPSKIQNTPSQIPNTPSQFQTIHPKHQTPHSNYQIHHENNNNLIPETNAASVNLRRNVENQFLLHIFALFGEKLAL